MKRSKQTSLLIAASIILLPVSAAFGQLSSGLLNYWNFEGNYNDTAETVAGSSGTVAFKIPAASHPLPQALTTSTLIQ